jgi:hypothetical protein
MKMTTLTFTWPPTGSAVFLQKQSPLSFGGDFVADKDKRTARLLSLLGRFGNQTDKELILPYLDDSNELVANVACESLLRLTDPMLVPQEWREL